MKENQQIERVVKKNDMHASNVYQLKRLTDHNFYFVSCSLEEAQDEIRFSYDITHMKNFSDSKKSRNSIKYGLLVQVLEAVFYNPRFGFSLSPKNLYIDLQNRIRVLERDYVPDKGPGDQRLSEFLALAGSYFQKKYTYEDYRNGGRELLKRQRKTRFLFDLTSLEEARDVLICLQKQELEKEQRNLITINRNGHHTKTAALCLLTAVGAGLTVFLVYQTWWLYYPQKHALMAERFYMENHLTMAADALQPIPAEQMDNHEKYLLAVVYIRGQSVDSFDLDTKERLISRLSYNGDGNLLDYWIYLGRLEVDKALDVAMRISDHQLLLYAYLQKLDQVASDTRLAGNEKAQQIDLLKSKIKTLADELGIKYKENQAEGEEAQ